MAHGPGTSTPARRIEVAQGDSRSAMNHRRDGETNRASGESKGHNHRSILFVGAYAKAGIDSRRRFGAMPRPSLRGAGRARFLDSVSNSGEVFHLIRDGIG